VDHAEGGKSSRELSIRVLGPLEVTSAAGRPVSIAGRKSHALLGYISAQPQCRESRDKLAALLSGDRYQDQARHSLRQAILRLRKALNHNGREFVCVTRTNSR
jgi:DNA-binding SARP family transcriptional activator